MPIDIERVLEELKHMGLKPEAAFLLSRRLGLDFMSCIRVLRETYGFDLVTAKEVGVRATGLASSLHEYQAKLAEALELALTDAERPAAP